MRDWRNMPRSLIFVLCMSGLIGLAIWALGVGASKLSLTETLMALFAEDDSSRAALIVQSVRLPRVIAALLTGASLAVAGAIIQAMTGNPLADPGLLGVNAGAALAVVCAIAFFGIDGRGALVWCAVLGATLTAACVLLLGRAGPGGAATVRLILAGVVVASFLASLTAIILVLDTQTQDVVRFWTVGSLKGQELSAVLDLLPYAILPILLALALSGQITVLSLGAEVARSIGQAQHLWQFVAAALVVALAGTAVAMAGPLSFVGLVVPHIARLLVGADYRRILPVAALTGAALTLLADTLPRAIWARDVPVGVTLALLGAPVFVWLAQRRGGAAR